MKPFKVFSIFFTTVVIIISICSSTASGSTSFNIYQVTDNPAADWRSSHYNGTIAWSRVGIGNSEIFYWNGNTIVQVSDSDGIYKREPSLYDGTISWYDEDGGIYYWDGFITIQISDNGKQASLYDGKIAWRDNGIYYWNGEDTIKISDSGTNPSLYDGKIAWSDNGIYYWNGEDTIKISDSGTNPSLCDGTIAWQDGIGDDNLEIYYWNGTDTIKVTNNAVSDMWPSLYKGCIAWQRWDGNDYEIFYWDGTNDIQISDNSTNDFRASLHKGGISWDAYDGYDYEIFYAVLTIEPTIEAILTFFDDSVADGSLKGYGHGNSANNRLNALRAKLQMASDLIDIGDIDRACVHLGVASEKCDGFTPPPDFVEGDAVTDLYDMILELMVELGCE